MRPTCLLVLLAASFPSALAPCPAWLSKYEEFHASARGQPGTRYLVHKVEGHGGGLGDRLRGALFALRVAAPLERVVLFEWGNPHPLTAFLEPSGRIDWRLNGTGYDGGGPVVKFMDHAVDHFDKAEDGSLAKVTDEFLTIEVHVAGCRGMRCRHAA